MDRLTAMLSGAKQIMNKVESGDYTTGNVDSRALTEDGVQQMMAEGVQRPQNGYNAMPQNGHSHQIPQAMGQPANYNTSKMPQAIKEAMLNSPQMPVINPYSAFELADVSAELIEKPLPISGQYRQPARQPVAENYAPQQYAPQQYAPQQIPAGMMMVNEAQLKQMMTDYMLKFMTDNFTKTLSETVIKKTIGTLIKEGKLTVKQKI